MGQYVALMSMGTLTTTNWTPGRSGVLINKGWEVVLINKRGPHRAGYSVCWAPASAWRCTHHLRAQLNPQPLGALTTIAP